MTQDQLDKGCEIQQQIEALEAAIGLLSEDNSEFPKTGEKVEALIKRMPKILSEGQYTSLAHTMEKMLSGSLELLRKEFKAL